MKKAADAVVIGGGIIGCSVARELARSGTDVVLIERSGIASAASGRNHGLLMYPQNQVVEPLYRASHAIYRDLAASGDTPFDLDEKPRGFLIVVSAQGQWAGAEAEAKASAGGGVAIEKLDGASLREAEPNLAPSFIGGWWIDDGYRLDPAALTLALALDARDAGAEVVTHLDAKRLLLSSERVVGLMTDEGTVQAEVVVLAAGPWIPRLAQTAGLSLPIRGARGWLLLTEAVEDVAHHLVESAGWHLIAGDSGPPPVTVEGYAQGERPAPPDTGVLIQQNPGGQVLIGGSRMASIRDDPEGPETTRDLARGAAATIPKLAEVPIQAAWSGVRPMTPDGIPLIGWAPSVGGLFIAGGHGGQGVILGGGTGRLAAQMIRGEETFCDPGVFRPGRFQ